MPLGPSEGLDRLTLARPQGEVLRSPPEGAILARTIRRDGVIVGSDPAKAADDAAAPTLLDL